MRALSRVLLCGIALAFFGLAAEPQPRSGDSELPSAASLAERLGTVWDPIRVRLEARLSIDRPGREPALFDLLIRRAEQGRTRVDFLAPEKDRGKVILQLGDETWMYLPRPKRVVGVPAGRNPLAGGVMFDDLFSPAGDKAASSVERTEDGYVLILTGSGRKGGTSRVYFRRSDRMPFRREIYAPSGRLLKTIHIEETRPWRGTAIPWKVRFVDHLRGGTEARIEVLKADELAGDVERLFSKDSLGPEPAHASPADADGTP